MKTNKLISVALLFVAIIIGLGALNISQAATDITTATTDELGYLKLTRDRTIARTFEDPENSSDPVTYRHELYSDNPEFTKNVWKLVNCDEAATATSEENRIKDLYCLRAGLGFRNTTGNTTVSVENKAVYYKYGVDLKNYSYLKKLFAINSETTLFDEGHEANYYAVLWILDNMLLEDATDIEVANYLVKYAGYTKPNNEPFTDQTAKEFLKRNDIITRADIEAIQQLALWYYTNTEMKEDGSTDYHSVELSTLYLSITGDASFDRLLRALAINGKQAYENGGYTYLSITDIYNIIDESGTEKQEHAEILYENLFRSMNEAVISANHTYKVKNRDMTLWLAGTNFAEEQPVVQVVEKEKYADISLRKFISKINGNKLGISREPVVYTQSFNKVVENELQTTAVYEHPKNPVAVEVGDKVTYTLRLYNEGNVDAYVKEVTDHLPSYLLADEEEATRLGWRLDFNETTKLYTATTSNCKIVNCSSNLKNSDYVGQTLDSVIIPAAEYDASYYTTDKNPEEPDYGPYTLSYVDIEITFIVESDAPSEVALTNIAEVTEMTEADGTTPLDDRDSQIDDTYVSKADGSLADNLKDAPPDSDGDGVPDRPNVTIDPNYMNEESEKLKYVPGNQDDDDFEKVIVKTNFDMALRKFITAINGTPLTGDKSREPQVDKAGFIGGTTAIYNHTKEPVKVSAGDVVTYTIRLYNEGSVAGRVKEVTDYIAKYLEYVPSDKEAQKKWWEADYTGKDYSTLTTTKDCIVTAVGGNTNEEYTGKLLTDVIIPAYDGEKVSYVDIQVNCVVKDVKVKAKITNIAEITKEAKIIPALDENGDQEVNEEGKPIYIEIMVDKYSKEDRDSVPDNASIPLEKDLPNYEGGKDYNLFDNYVPGQEDDDDFEKLYIEPYFDLALRKFITGVGNVSVNNRYPIVSYENEKISYKHPKDPVPVATGDIVTYTIRVYNEGQADGYANEITDDLPAGIEFLPDNELNKEYRWVMLDSNQKVTTDVKQAKYIVTDYLSEEQEKETGRKNKLNAFDLEGAVKENKNENGEVISSNPDYRDVKVAFKVTYVPTTKEEASRIIINEAQISKDSDDDIDSDPNRDEKYDYTSDGKNEDDIDYDNIIVKYFDLALLKWVSETHVTLDGKTTIYDAGNSEANAHNENIPQLVLGTNDIKKVTVKYLYTIKVMNEGELDGYATEIKDHIPEGLYFDKNDPINQKYKWQETNDGKVTTDILKDTLLKAGKDENVTVQIMFTWKNDKENLGSKVNYAEISKDDNPGKVPDIDSTPDNFKDRPREDDEDDAEVIITIKTGAVQMYLGLTGAIILIFGSGVTLIKKYVL